MTNAKKELRCILCGKKAKWIEWSPDGASDLFCTMKHFKINKDYHSAQGISWRASPVRRVSDNDIELYGETFEELI